MRSFELSTHIKAVQRAQGGSATAKAAYRACCVIACEREGRVHDYSRKGGLEASEIVLPEGAPAWARDRAKLWNAAELTERNKDSRAKTPFKADARTARDFMFTFPAELSKEGRLKVARTVAQYLVSTSAVAVDFNIHEPGREGDERNYHCHIMFTTRRMEAKGLGEKCREWDKWDKKKGEIPTEAKKLRQFVGQTLNAEIKAEGKADLVKVEYLSFKARGSPQKVTQRHMGPAKTHIIRKQQAVLRRDWEQAQRRQQRERHGKERAALKLRQDFDLQRRLAELDLRERKGREQINRDLEQQRRADIPAKGFRRAFQIVTGQEVKEAFNRQHREAERVKDAEQRRASLATEIRAERNAYVRGQTDERERLAQSHIDEDRQLVAAVEHRKSLDRTAEVHARRIEFNTNSRQHRREDDRDDDREQSRGGRSIGREIPPL